MGWSHGVNDQGRDIGYGVEAVCDLPGCDEKIDRGMYHLCGGCCGYFCGGHLISSGDFAEKRAASECVMPSGDRCPTCVAAADGTTVEQVLAEVEGNGRDLALQMEVVEVWQVLTRLLDVEPIADDLFGSTPTDHQIRRIVDDVIQAAPQGTWTLMSWTVPSRSARYNPLLVTFQINSRWDPGFDRWRVSLRDSWAPGPAVREANTRLTEIEPAWSPPREPVPKSASHPTMRPVAGHATDPLEG